MINIREIIEPAQRASGRTTDRVGHKAGRLYLLLAFLIVVSGVGLSASLHFPEVLLDDRSFGRSLVESGIAAVVFWLAGWLLCGGLIIVLSRALVPLLPEGDRTPVVLLGGAAGLCWGASAVLVLVLVPLWGGDIAGGVSPLSWAAFVSGMIVAPLLLAAWTVLVVRAFRGARATGVAGAFGLVVTALRWSVCAVDSQLSVEKGFYYSSALLTVVALLTFPVWLVWLVRMSSVVKGAVQWDKARGQSRPFPVATARRIGGGLLIVLLAFAHAVALIVSTPTPKADHAPAVPTAMAGTFYVVMQNVVPDPLPFTYEGLLAERKKVYDEPPKVPSWASLEKVNADGVPAERICARQVRRDRVIFYAPGGGFIMPASNGARGFAAGMSRAAGMCVLMVHYRLAPEHPFPAGLQDAVKAYRWLVRQGIPASRTAIVGDSAGGNLVLTIALSLRDGDEPLPAALVPISAWMDATMSGSTFRTKVSRDSLLTPETVRYTFNSYTRHGAANRRDPLLSPLFANPAGLPPTLLIAGSQEVLLNDSVRMHARLKAAHVPGRLEVWRGMPHAFPLVAAETPESRMMVEQAAAFVTQYIP